MEHNENDSTCVVPAGIGWRGGKKTHSKLSSDKNDDGVLGRAGLHVMG